MDSKFALRFVLVLLLTSPLFVTGNMQAEAVQPYEETKKHEPSGMINVGLVSAVLSDKGYHAMSLTLDMVLDAINPNATLTLFCPQDKAFFKSKYPQPPLTLLKYHAVPFKMDKDSMDASFRHGSKVDTLLPGHPLVVTSLLAGTHGYASLNLVKVTEWDLYNNGRLIVHGVEDFFDPAFQTLRYPQYDVIAKDFVSCGGVSWLKEATDNWFLVLGVAAASTFVLVLVFFFCAKPSKTDDFQYSPLYYGVLGHVSSTD
ncbi:hypothetical protein D8674_023374 [Pyrus ussuriensis x Pyrus communis]|uniref:FAS1 domain-containing protein n=1 Tax=Pyrus ussuriensis x Pyrus communis TaxID=2448454 RepID=A0A5N5GMJ4_9ROSA|nr:hypothetical protein D8674_023374 [Pyrus ussuriensis x Pyrus communis]